MLEQYHLPTVLWATVAPNLPRRVIEIDGKPYLERYFMGEDVVGHQLWLHHFLSDDPDRFLHDHPGHSTSIILSGGYQEDIYLPASGAIYGRWLMPFSTALQMPGQFHRIATILPDTWTLVIVENDWWEAEQWHFLDEDGNKHPVPKTNNREWYRNHEQ